MAGAQLGKFEVTVQDSSGNAKSGASVTLRLQGASVAGNQSGTSPLTVNVDHVGAIYAGDGVAINTGSTTYNVDSVTASTVVLSGFSGTLSLTDNDRITVVSPGTLGLTLFNNAFSAESVSNPLTTDSSGYASAFVQGGYYDYVVSGTGLTTTLYIDYYVSAARMLISIADGGANPAFQFNTNRTASSSLLINVSNNGTQKFSISSAGAVTCASALTVSAGGVTITGNSTITGTLSGLTGLTMTSGATTLAAGLTVPTNHITVTAGDLKVRRLIPMNGTALVSGDFALGAGWGTTATIGAIQGSDTSFVFTVTSAGSGQSASTATVTLTYKDLTFSGGNCIAIPVRGDATAPTTGFWSVGTITTSSAVLQFQGLPVAGSAYKCFCVILGRAV